MTESNSSNRSKLTLKLNLKNKVEKENPKEISKNISPKNTKNETKENSHETKSQGFNKSSKNSVQVTIKGRKNNSGIRNNSDNNQLNSNEIEARFKAITDNSAEDTKDNIKTHEILTKISKENKNSQIANNATSKNIKEISVDQDLETKEIKNTNNNNTSEIEDIKTQKTETLSTSSNLNDDNFDVRNKIKLSILEANKIKEEREKILEEKKKKEIDEQNEKQKIENDKKKHKKTFSTVNQKTYQEEEFIKKNNIKESKSSKFNSRKLTYFISSNEDFDDEFGHSSRRKKPKLKIIEEPKEYKKITREVNLPELITVAELSERMSEKAGDVVKKLFSMGMVVTSNQAIDAETAEIIIHEFGHISKRVSHSDVENILEDNDEKLPLLPRAPVVTIMGHVDHGKTSLLDALRSTDIALNEHGGITQHIGASRIETLNHKFITFLDTPGHEAFTEMRSRGANITDIVVLVVAADDGVKAQTIEALNHAKAANVPIIVAINKIDKNGAKPENVKNELLSHQLVSEDLGGDVMFIEVSAKSKINLDKLEEAILLQSEILDLKAPYQGKSSGVVLESRVDPNKGVIATFLVQKGTLDIGDIIVVGTSFGKVRKMSDSNNKILKNATPSMPVEVMGLDFAPNAGDKFVEVDEERQAREIISYRTRKEKENKALKNSLKSITDIFKESGKGKLKYLNIIIKGDVNGSVEAIIGTIIKLNNDEVAIKIIHSATGGITENDVNLANASKAIIIGFNVRANISAKELAVKKFIEIRYYSIIYNLVDDIKMLLSGMLTPTSTESYLGQAEIRQIFKISNIGKICGSFVIDGIIKRNAKVRVLRDNVVIFDGILKTLKRFKDDVKEAKSGLECGIAIDNFDDIKEKDIIECYEITEQKRII